MSLAVTSSPLCVCAAVQARRPVKASLGNFAGLKRQGALASRSQSKTLVGSRQSQSVRPNVTTSAAMEMFQIADELSYISGVAGVTFAITLVGLAAGFVLLRIEALTEEGKL